MKKFILIVGFLIAIIFFSCSKEIIEPCNNWDYLAKIQNNDTNCFKVTNLNISWKSYYLLGNIDTNFLRVTNIPINSNK